MKRKRLPIVLLVAALCLLALVFIALRKEAEQDAAGAQREMLIGVSHANLIESWRIHMNEEIISASKAYDNIRLIITDAAMDTYRQREDIEVLMGYGIDLLIISPNNSKALEEDISRVNARVPVIVLDHSIPEADFTLYIGPDNRVIGRIAGEYIASLLGKGGGNVVEIKGSDGASATLNRRIGFHEVLNAHPAIRVQKEITSNWMQDQAEDRMKEYLPIATEPIDAIFAYNDAMAYGAAIALDAFRLPRAPIIGVDGLAGPKGGIELVKDGILQATIVCPTGGQQAVDYAMRILSKESGLPRNLILEPRLIDMKQAAAALAANVEN